MYSCLILYESIGDEFALCAVMQHPSHSLILDEYFEDVHCMNNEFAFTFSDFSFMIYSYPFHTIYAHERWGLKAFFVDKDGPLHPVSLPQKWRPVAFSIPVGGDRDEPSVRCGMIAAAVRPETEFFLHGELLA